LPKINLALLYPKIYIYIELQKMELIMGTISLRIDDELLAEVTSQARALHLTRTEYLRRAIAEMREKIARDLRRRRLQEASRKVRAESMLVNREFAEIEDAPDA
jgi:hypothetical protein